MGILEPNDLACFLENVEGMSGVQIGPGVTALTGILFKGQPGTLSGIPSSRAVMAGVDIRSVQELMGHSTIT